ncbi:iron complex outermembrane receptor protein [Paucibacter oligotrophus]|uniref:Iron complex outermembrane receptor protein n=1 Tax=Roseateles oligotrophus TaxID=1769250 RepID=A0A840L796_9BURK|nr:TonB-dependent receptor [Roseateles oligotrophus]MBB4843651.1 iron complex outermembrane receptor protein [Roseateles oligotrophus]
MQANPYSHPALRPTALALAVFTLCLAQPAARAQTAAAPASASTKLEAVVVTGIRASKEKSLTTKRYADGVTDVVSAEDIGKMPDKNVADALQKLPGVTTTAGTGGQGGYDENDRVSLRGTGPSLALTTINGHSVATADWDASDQLAGGAGSAGSGAARSVSYLLFPSEIVSQVMVHKSSQADQVEGGVSGAVNIVTRRPLEFKKPLTVEASVQAVYSDLAGKTDPQLSALLNWKSPTGSVGVMLQAFDQKRHVRRDSQNISWGLVSPTSAAGQANGGQLSGKVYANAITQTVFQQERQRRGGLLGIELAPLEGLKLGVEAFQSKLDARYVQNQFVVRPGNSVGGGIVPTHAQLSGDLLSAAQFNNTGNATGAQLETFSNPNASSSTNYLNADFKYQVSDALKLSGQLGTTKAEGNTYLYWNYIFLPNTATSYAYNGADKALTVGLPGGLSAANLTYLPGNSGADNSYSLQRSVDKEDYRRLDAEYGFNEGWLHSLKFGWRDTSHRREGSRPLKGGPPVNATNNGASLVTSIPTWSGNSFYPSDFGSALGAGFPTASMPLISTDEIVSWSKANLPVGSGNYNLPVSGVFTVKEDTRAFYGMVKFGGDSWRGDLGLRHVKTKVQVTTNQGVPCGVPRPTNTITFGSQAQTDACVGGGFVPEGATLVTGSRFGNFIVQTTDSDYSNVLPSANLSFDATKDLVLRASAAKVMARPDYSALGATLSGFGYNLANIPPSTASGGSATLKPVVAKSYNLGIEWYFQPRALLSVQLFRLEFDSLIGAGTSMQNLLNTAIPTGLGGPQIVPTLVSSPKNTTGRSQGIELGYEQPLFRGFGVQANYTYVDAKEENGMPLLGASKNSYTLGGYYEEGAFSTRLTYSQRGKARVGLYGLSQNYAAPTGTLAASLNYSVNDRLTLTFEGLNLNNPKLRYYNAPSATVPMETTTALHSSGRQFYMGARMKF